MAAHRNSRRKPRRGIVLLIVISLLVLFMLILVTFAVVSGSYRDASQAFAYRKALQVKFDENTAVMDDIINMVLGEPASSSSALRGQSLLGDMYGKSVNGVISSATVAEGAGAFAAFYGTLDPQQTFAGAQFSNSEDYYVGCVITMKDGPCAGLSTRITHYYPGNRPTWIPPPMNGYSVDDVLVPGDPNDPISLRMEAFDNGLLPQTGNHFVINDKPFNGTGLGRPLTGEYANNAFDPYPPDGINLPWALMPHLAGWLNRGNARSALLGGADEPWDSFDFQNMFLSLVPSDPSGPGIIKPSYFDQALMAYWDNLIDMSDDGTRNLSKSLYDAQHLFLLRQIMLRPLRADHPNFDGSNPSYALFETPNAPAANFWDVDNDKDGVPDSIWIDPGLPVASAPDGRKYKRLVALLIRDQDGKVNINAGGSVEFATAATFVPPLAYPGQPGTPVPDPIPATPATEPLAGGPPAPSQFPRGLGVGPAEINPLNLFMLDGESLDLASANYRRLFQGTPSNPLPPNGPIASSGIPGKWGLDQFYSPSGARTSIPANRRPGIWGPNGPGVFSNDPLSVVKTQGFGLEYAGPVFSNYASPSDVWGRGAIALDYAGQPYHAFGPPFSPYTYGQGQPTDWMKDTDPATIPSPPGPLGPQLTAEINDNPYEINLIDGPQSYDTPYTVAELEALLRRFDADLDSLPPRLYNFLNVSTPGGLIRRINTLTTLSSSNNAPRGALPYYMRTGMPTDTTTWKSYGYPVAGTILDICGSRVAFENGAVDATTGAVTMPASLQQSIVKQIMPFEFYHGEMFNLNRPFGNGVDDNGNGVVDEPGETNNNAPGYALTEPAWTAGPFALAPASGGGAYPLNDAQNYWWTPPGATAPVAFPASNNDPHLYARQLYARHLYCMLLLFCDPNYITTTFPASLTETPLTPAQVQALFCRRMAQFAINAVDNRDPDTIMTPFEYDLNPWDGWNVDGDLMSDETTVGLPVGMRGVVWGMEQPDLILKETISFHNKRIQDTMLDPGMTGRDSGTPDDLDQLRLPQGSTFIELFCPRARVVNNPKLPLELYNPAGLLDVGRLAPPFPVAQGGDGAPHPVWQIAISEYLQDGSTVHPNALIGTKPDSFSPEPTLNPTASPGTIQLNLFDPSEVLKIERYVWMTTAAPVPATGQQDNTFYAEGPAGVAPGGYLVIAPRPVTAMGSLDDLDPATFFTGDSPQKIDINDTMNGNQFTVRDLTGTVTSRNAVTQIQNVAVLVASADPPRAGEALVDGSTVTAGAGWDGGTRRIGLNVTEPLPHSGLYYLFPTDANDAYTDLSAAAPPATLPDKPFDYVAGMPLSTPSVAGEEMYATQTYKDRHAIVLQRLANPLQGWHPVLNPYINVDWAGNDVTVFAGDDRTDRNAADGMPWDRDSAAGITYDPNPWPGTRNFGTRQRGNAGTGPANVGTGQLWYPRTDLTDVPDMTPVAGSGVYFSFNLVHTLGYVNGRYDATGTLDRGIARPLGNPANPAIPGDLAVPPLYVGDPSVPFPWITWNNRPYANPMELLNVPTSSPQRICQEFFYSAPGDTYDVNNIAAGSVVGFYQHLLNFFLTTVNQPGGMPPIRHGSDFHRVFDFAETPSPYVGTETWYGPAAVNASPGSAVTYQDPGTGYRAPFNRLSRGRDPGKININTVVDHEVWDAIVANYPEMQTFFPGTSPPTPRPWPAAGSPPLFVQMLQSRRGYAADPSNPDVNTSADMFRSNPNYPTLFANPFRPADAFDLQPLSSMQLNRPVDATLLRGGGSGAGTPVGGPLPLFNYTGYDVGNLSNPGAYPNLSRATDRNSYFRYQPFTKLANMVTTNSNTFAVWMTVGYFEVTPNPAGVDTAHPDGWQLGQEMLFDGVVRRPRAFFLIDRSIPVGFEPGKPLNVDKCVLQRRYMD
jgi:hypothetical protein